MQITGIVPCLNYSDYLATSLQLWSDTLDRLLVVTHPDDKDTLELCRRIPVSTYATTIWQEHGADFNKAAALDRAIEYLNPQDWILTFDADVKPPDDWRAIVERKAIKGFLNGAYRDDEQGNLIPDCELPGCFFLFHSSDIAVRERPMFGSWRNAGSYDSYFQLRWPSEKRIKLPLKLTHQGPCGANWCGRDKPDLMFKMWTERKIKGGYLHEQITANSAGDDKLRPETR